MKSDVHKSIKEALVDALRHKIDLAYRESQYKVPVKTGKLKLNSDFTVIENGGQITYSMPYSSFVERGIKGGMQNVRGHYRNGNWVKPFQRYMPPREGVRFIRNSVNSAFKELPHDFESLMKLKGFKIERK